MKGIVRGGAGQGTAWPDLVRRGVVWLGEVWLVKAGRGRAWVHL